MDYIDSFQTDYNNIAVRFSFSKIKVSEENTVGSRHIEYSISQTLLYLKQFIRSLGHLAFDWSKILSVSRIFTFVEQIFRSLEQFSPVISTFSQNFQSFCRFSSKISLF